MWVKVALEEAKIDIELKHPYFEAPKPVPPAPAKEENEKNE